MLRAANIQHTAPSTQHPAASSQQQYFLYNHYLMYLVNNVNKHIYMVPIYSL